MSEPRPDHQTSQGLGSALPLAACAAFFLSGASSLIFQAIWTRLLHHVFGATSVAMSSVLTVFMAGLGLGARLFGARAARVKRPLRAYALCELGVAAWAFGLPSLLRSDGPFVALNQALRESLGAQSFGFMLARFVCVVPLLLVPTTLMGGTLPFLAQYFVRGQGQSSARTGALYAVNTLGAVLGTALGSFALMPAVGVHATNLVAVAINAVLGLTLLLLDRRPVLRGVGELDSKAEAGVGERAPLVRWARLCAVLAFALSGACAMTYEVVWSRALSMTIGSSMQAFALILVTFLVGIAGGSAAVSHVLGRERSALSFALACSAFLALLALLPAMVLEGARLPALVWLALVGGSLAMGRVVQKKALDDRALAEALEEPGPTGTRDGRERFAEWLVLLPCAIALVELTRFATKRSTLTAPALHGYLPFIVAAVVLSISSFFFACLRFRRAPWLLMCAVQLGIALATLLGYAFQDEVPYTFARLVTSLEDLPDHVGTVRFFMLLTAGLCTLPATLGMGAMFPLTLELWSQKRDEVGRDVGTVYSANTAGSILGAWLPGFVLLPRLGMEATLQAGMMLNAAVALGLSYAALRLHEARGAARALCAGSLAMLTLLCWLASSASPLAWNLSHMTLGAFRVSLTRDMLDPAVWGKPDLLYYHDGVSTTVSVERWGAHLSLKNNGKVDASNGDDMPTQIMVAAYPLLLHARGPQDLDVAIVGFGSGVTVGAALSFPVRHVDAMELEASVVDGASRFFSDVNHLPRKHESFPFVAAPRLTLHNDDGRNFLAATRAKYDVIISEPSNPWITGVSDLFTVDHFRVSKKRLKPGGVYCQWVQLYEMSPENIKTIYRTFASQFRYVLAFAAEELSSDTILVGSDSPLPIDLAHTRRVMSEPRVKAELARAFLFSPYDFWSRTLFASQGEIMRFTQIARRFEHGKLVSPDRSTGAEPCMKPACTRAPAELNTDDNMHIELRAPNDLIGYQRYVGYLELFYGKGWPYGELSERLKGLDDPEQRAAMALSLLAHGRMRQARILVEAMKPSTRPDTQLAMRTARLLLELEPAPEPSFAAPEPGAPLTKAIAHALAEAHALTLRALARKDAKSALTILDSLAPALLHTSGPDFQFLYGFVMLKASDGDRSLERAAVDELEHLLRDNPAYAREHPETYFYLARAQKAGARFDRAVRTMRTYAELSSAH
jgi:spermidine synthase